MSENASFGSPVDNIRRDIKDNAYHCPQCDTPFTRRSNLRRHFQIHTRSSILKCENCNEDFASRDELQSHAPGCYSWTFNDKALQSMERPYGKDGTDMLESSRGLTQSLDGRSYAAPPSAYSTFDSPESRYLGSYGASDFTQVMPALSSSSAVMPPTPPLVSSFDGSYVNASSSPNVFPNRRPSISSSGSSSASSSPYTQPPTHVQQAAAYGFYPSTEVRADGSPWSAVPPALSAPGEKPVYTRRQVKDMIDVVSECLIESMESVLTRPTSVMSSPVDMQLDTPDGQLVRAMRDDGFRQTVLSEALPRAYYRMHSNSGTHPKV
ncbi:hypothetical protein HYPSUDRAFT_217009 [Hypholoma sublateritium FD-334 SS-4]|uniref:C2H2-type domain-containing protein n=1 Tax=Hypholoma sublateritium (strain FD-334 SS-4) TaxID=945553 RepID=A0A0D2L198_HYPSF|nr:hypothetical protein HYPSUDRAFT_217009 [Hypholoma sublateritium FD-334 SS-4]